MKIWESDLLYFISLTVCTIGMIFSGLRKDAESGLIFMVLMLMIMKMKSKDKE